ncbi:hypothetical protein BC830DRAFT_1123337 [Chytriomyces sp. MP71]|nr:hypothetical protein BC830DRAFT_1123337 [Chytriomyces sp. MP71]
MAGVPYLMIGSCLKTFNTDTSKGVLLYKIAFRENPFHNPSDIIRGYFYMHFDAELESDKEGKFD